MEQPTLLLSIVLYKVASLVAGVCISYMGYRLFIYGIWGSSGTMRIRYRGGRLKLSQAAPGTFFAVLGAIVIAVTVLRGLEYEGGINTSQLPPSRSPVVILPDKPPDLN